MKLQNKFDTNKLLFSPSAMILCCHDVRNRWWVLNGHYIITISGPLVKRWSKGLPVKTKKMHCLSTEDWSLFVGDDGDTVRVWNESNWSAPRKLMGKFTVNDWEQYTRAEFNKKYPNFGY